MKRRFGHAVTGMVYGGGIVSFPLHGGSPPCTDAGGPLAERGPIQATLEVS